uniref:Uncharacterized protein n=1 Tax=Arundo donax TaxID=35708 RepID=A0A0A9ARV7_ARUDO
MTTRIHELNFNLKLRITMTHIPELNSESLLL